MGNRGIAATAAGVLVATVCAVPSHGQTPISRLTAGAVALVAADDITPAGESLLMAALSDVRPSVRAAAARVAFTQARRGLVQQAVVALQSETDGDAAVEQARFIAAFAPPESDPVLLDAAMRSGQPTAARIALILAKFRGGSALAYLRQLLPIGGNVTETTTLVSAAARGDRAVLEGLLGSARRDGDVKVVAATLGAARQDAAPLAEGAIVSLLGPANAPEIRALAAAHVLLSLRPGDVMPDAVRAALETAAPVEPPDPATELIAELARRLAGAPPRDDAAWISVLTERGREVHQRLREWNVLDVSEQLSASEYAAFTAAIDGQPRPRPDPSSRQAAGGGARPSGIRFLSGYPAEFVASLFESARCDIARQNATGSGASVSYSADGRVNDVSLIDPPTSSECARAMRALLLTYLPALDRSLGPNEQEILMFPFEPRFVACQAATTRAAEKLAGDGRITPPQQIRKVNPVYPPGAQMERVAGTVVVEARISPEGCIEAAAVTRSVDLRLDWAALRAIAAWTYTPALLNGVAVPVIMTVTVAFVLE
jgi:TonB family protein